MGERTLGRVWVECPADGIGHLNGSHLVEPERPAGPGSVEKCVAGQPILLRAIQYGRTAS